MLFSAMHLISFSPKNSSTRSYWSVARVTKMRWEICDLPRPYRWYTAKLEFKPSASGVCNTNPELLILNWVLSLYHAAFPHKVMTTLSLRGTNSLGSSSWPCNSLQGRNSHHSPSTCLHAFAQAVPSI